MSFVVYELIDPRDSRPKYVGMTDDVYERFIRHLRGDSKNHRKDAWIRELKALNQMVIMRVLHVTETEAEARVKEAYWIDHYLSVGYPLLNNQIPMPFNEMSKRRQKSILNQIARPALSLEEKAQRVAALESSGEYSQAQIISLVWGPGFTSGRRYNIAKQELETIRKLSEGSIGASLNHSG